MGAGLVYVDVDIVNCFATLLWKELLECIGEVAQADFDVLHAFVWHCQAWRVALAEYLDIPLKSAKKMLIGRPQGRPAISLGFVSTTETGCRHRLGV